MNVKRSPLNKGLVVLLTASLVVGLASFAFAGWSLTLPSPFQVTGAKIANQVVTAPDGNGGLLVAWVEDFGMGDYHARVQRLDPSGNPVWLISGGVHIGEGDGSVTQLDRIDICSDGQGGAYVGWGIHELLGGVDVKVQHVDGTTGATTWGAGRNASNGHYHNVGPTWSTFNLIPDGQGGVLIAWLDDRNQRPPICGSGQYGGELFAQRYDASGTQLWPDGGQPISQGTVNDQVSDLTARRPVEAGGFFYFVWTDCPNGDVRVQRVDGSGIPVFWPLGGVPVIIGGDAIAHAASCQGDCLVATASYLGSVIVKRVHGPDHTTQWTDTLNTQFSRVRGGTAASNGLDGVLVAWWDQYGLDPGQYYVQSVGPSGQLLMPIKSDSNLGTGLGPNQMTWDPSAPPSVVPDGKQGLILVSEGVGSPSALFCQGVSLYGRLAFPKASQMVSPPGQAATTVSGSPGILNYGLFAWSDANGAFATSVPLSNVDVNTTPPGWAGPLVPRSLPDATPNHANATALFENQTTWLNWAVHEDGPNPTPAFQSRVHLDVKGLVGPALPSPFQWAFDIPDGGVPGFFYYRYDKDSVLVAGGPHTLTLYADASTNPDSSIDETSEGDDVYSQQWIWEPAWVAEGFKHLECGAPPNCPWCPIPNGNGHKLMTPQAAMAPNAWVVSTAARRGPTYDPNGTLLGYGDSYGLMMYDLPVGAGEYTHQIGASHQAFNGTNFVLALSPASPESLYSLQVRDSVQDSDPDSMYTDFEAAGARMGAGSNSSWQSQTMAGGELADMYLLNANARQPLHISLRQRASSPVPPSHLAFEVFQPISGSVYARGGGMASQMVSADFETLSFVATRSGPQMVVVYRADGTNAGTPVVYDFNSSSMQTVDVAGESAHTLSFAGASPNPSRGETELAFSLPARAVMSLEVYDLNGRRVRVLATGSADPGEHRVHWDGRTDTGAALPDGLYFARLECDGHVLSRRVTLMR
jgi:hypothetical protein